MLMTVRCLLRFVSSKLSIRIGMWGLINLTILSSSDLLLCYKIKKQINEYIHNRKRLRRKIDRHYMER